MARPKNPNPVQKVVDDVKTNAAPDAAAIPKRKKWKQKTLADRRYRRDMKKQKKILPRSTLCSIIRRIAYDFKTDVRFTRNAIKTMIEYSENMLIDVFGKAYTNSLMRSSNKQGANVTTTNYDLAQAAGAPMYTAPRTKEEIEDDPYVVHGFLSLKKTYKRDMAALKKRELALKQARALGKGIADDIVTELAADELVLTQG